MKILNSILPKAAGTPLRLFLTALILIFIPLVIHGIYKIALVLLGCTPVLEKALCNEMNTIVGSTLGFIFTSSWFLSSYLLLVGYILIPTSLIYYMVNLIKKYRNGTKEESQKAITIFVILSILIAFFTYAGIAERMEDSRNEREGEKNAKILESIKLSIKDVDGTNLPSGTFDLTQYKTIEGVDSNHNYVRDDVELALFAEYPIMIKNNVDINLKERASAMQYAQVMQLLLTKVNSKKEMRVVLEKKASASICMDLRRVSETEVKNKILDSQARKDRYEKSHQSYMTSFGINPESNCEI